MRLGLRRKIPGICLTRLVGDRLVWVELVVGQGEEGEGKEQKE